MSGTVAPDLCNYTGKYLQQAFQPLHVRRLWSCDNSMTKVAVLVLQLTVQEYSSHQISLINTTGIAQVNINLWLSPWKDLLHRLQLAS